MGQSLSLTLRNVEAVTSLANASHPVTPASSSRNTDSDISTLAMTPSLASLTRPVGQLSHAEIEDLAKQVPAILSSNPKDFSTSPLSFLFSAAETADLWTIYENLLLVCLRTGNDHAAHQCIERLVLRFGDTNERVMAFKGLLKEAQTNSDAEVAAVLKEYEEILAENSSNIVGQV